MKRQCIALAVFALAALAVLAAGRQWEYRRGAPARAMPNESIGQLNRLQIGGQTHVEKTGLTSILLLGVDDATAGGARSGGQADFLLLVVIDHSAETVRQLQIDRDVVVEVDTLGVLGNLTGRKPMQICLAQVFGESREQNCANTKRAVERMLGVSVDCCVALDMDAIAALNDALGGVVVTLTDDLSAIDQQMTKGAALRLTGEQAEKFVRSRMEIGDGTNQSRMRRQQAFIEAAAAALRERLRERPGFIGELFDALAGDMTADVSRNRLLNEANRAWNYSAMSIETLPGQHVIGADGFVEFHATPGAAEEWAVSAFYQLEQGDWR